MGPRYLHLLPDEAPPKMTGEAFRAVIVADVPVGQDWRKRVAEWLVESGCLYVVAWGVECENWHDTVDWASLEAFDHGDIPDDKIVMTTWHADEPLSEALWFSGHCASHPDVELGGTLIVHIANQGREAEMLVAYSESQTSHDQ